MIALEVVPLIARVVRVNDPRPLVDVVMVGRFDGGVGDVWRGSVTLVDARAVCFSDFHSKVHDGSLHDRYFFSVDPYSQFFGAHIFTSRTFEKKTFLFVCMSGTFSVNFTFKFYTAFCNTF